jgi:nicotinamide mononucleotide transporter
MIYHYFIVGIESLSWAEAGAVIFAIISVLCARANSIWVYPTGIAGILLSIYIFIGEQYKLYPDAALNFYYLVMSVYGWYFWVRGGSSKENNKEKDKQETPVTWCNRKELWIAAAIFAGLWIILYWWLSTYNINNVPIMDSFSSAMASAGMWLLAKRKVENWIALLIADFVDIFMFFVKKLILFSALSIFYVIIAWLGYLAWKKWAKKGSA